MIEDWRLIPGFQDYIASNTGKIKTIKEYIVNPLNGVPRLQKNRHFKKDSLVGKKLSKKGYLRVRLDAKTYQVHRLIALTFLSNPDNKPQINHKDGNKLNNNINNLEWVTNQENRDHAVKYNLVSRRDKNCTNQKLTIKQCLEVVRLYNTTDITQLQIAKIYNVNQQTISKIIAEFTA